MRTMKTDKTAEAHLEAQKEDALATIIGTWPECDICKSVHASKVLPAVYDAKTIFGPWAFLCKSHFNLYARYPDTLGLGRGQRLVLPKPRAVDIPPIKMTAAEHPVAQKAS